jgi:threonine dehydratase
MYHSLRAGRMVRVPDLPSIADGIAGNIELDTMTFGIIQKYIDGVVLVSEQSIAAAMKHLLEREKLVVEGAGAASVAAVMEGRVSADAKTPAVAVITGGNVDLPALS